MYTVITPLRSLYELVDSHSRVDKCATVGSCRINCLLLGDDLVMLPFSEQGFQQELDRFSVACD